MHCAYIRSVHQQVKAQYGADQFVRDQVVVVHAIVRGGKTGSLKAVPISSCKSFWFFLTGKT